MSPGSFYDGTAVWEVYGTTSRFDGSSVDIGGGDNGDGVRPSLSLVSSTKVTGSGTATNPYKIVS